MRLRHCWVSFRSGDASVEKKLEVNLRSLIQVLLPAGELSQQTKLVVLQDVGTLWQQRSRGIFYSCTNRGESPSFCCPTASSSAAFFVHLMVRSQVVHLPPEDFCPKLFANELHDVQLVLEARWVTSQSEHSRNFRRMPKIDMAFRFADTGYKRFPTSQLVLDPPGSPSLLGQTHRRLDPGKSCSDWFYLWRQQHTLAYV